MRPVGFSTGALAKSDFRRGLDLQRGRGIRAVELSALRLHELEPFIRAIPSLDLTGFDYISFHAPSEIPESQERSVLGFLASLPSGWPIVVHPGIMFTPSLWRPLGSRLCIENMDSRKSMGRTAKDVRELFCVYPEATFCLDVGHARQVDPTMASALLMLMENGDRLRQLHVSDIGPQGEHLPLTVLSRWAYERIAHHVPEACPLIIESMVSESSIDREVDAVLAVFTHDKARGNRLLPFA